MQVMPKSEGTASVTALKGVMIWHILLLEDQSG